MPVIRSDSEPCSAAPEAASPLLGSPTLSAMSGAARKPGGRPRNVFHGSGLRAALLFYGGVGMLFGPVGVLIGSSLAQDRPLWKTAYWIGIGAVVGILWSMGGTLHPRWFIPAVLASMFYGWSWAVGFPRALAIETAAPNMGMLLYVLLMIGSYVLFSVYISLEGAKRLRLQAEIDLAGEIHRTLVPEIDREIGGVRVLGMSSASSEMGGDLIDIVEGGGGAVDLYLADVSGHGVKAGVVMGMVKSALRMRLLRAAPLGEVLADLNTTLCAVTSGEMFCTLACLRLNPGEGEVRCSLAGHLPVMVRRAGDGRVERVDNDSLPLGVTPIEGYDEQRVEAGPGDLLVLYTDGFIEAMDREGDMFGLERLERVISEHGASELREVAARIGESVRAHSGTDAQADDESLLLVRVGA